MISAIMLEMCLMFFLLSLTNFPFFMSSGMCIYIYLFMNNLIFVIIVIYLYLI